MSVNSSASMCLLNLGIVSVKKKKKKNSCSNVLVSCLILICILLMTSMLSVFSFPYLPFVYNLWGKDLFRSFAQLIGLFSC